MQELDRLGFPGYAVDDQGVVWTCWLGQGRKPSVQGICYRALKPNKQPNGYVQLTLYTGEPRRPRTFLVHRLVMLAFCGPCPEGMQVCHEDGNPANNVLTNLRYETPKGNQADRKKHGTDNRSVAIADPSKFVRGEAIFTAKVTEEQVREIRKRRAEGEKVVDIAREFGMSRDAISDITNRKSWKHVE